MEPRIWHRSYEPGVPPSLTFEQLTLPQYLERAAARHPDVPAVVFLNCRLTYRELKEQVDRMRAALAGLGVTKDVKVAIHLPNLPQLVIAYYATLSLGAQAVMTNPLYVAREIEQQWNDAGCRVAVTADFLYAGRVAALRDKLPVRHYVIASIPEYLRFPLNVLAPLKLKRMQPPSIARVPPGPGIHFFRRLLRDTAAAVPPAALRLDDVAVLLYTGGTTGPSKGAQLTHRNLSYNVQQLLAWFPGITEGREVFLGALPYFHSFGLTVVLGFAPVVAGTQVLVPNPRDIPAVIKAIQRRRVTLCPAVPAMFNAIVNFPGVERLDLRSVKRCFSGAAPLPVDLLQRFERMTGAVICEGFGLTETSPVTHSNPVGGKRKPGSIGVPLPDTEARIVDLERGTTDVPAGQEGELVIRGPQVMHGYWNRPEETANMIRNGWLYTGDLARMDEEGYFYIVGRKKDMIIAGGFNIYPDEIDRILMAHPAVLEAASIGIPDERRGETVKSFVVLKPGARATAEEIIAYCRENLAAYKVPRFIEFRDSLPKSSVLKILRRELREQELAKAGPERSEGTPGLS